MNVMRVANGMLENNMNDIMNNMCYIINVIFDESEEFKTLVGIFNEDAANKILKQLRNITPRYGTMRIDVEAYNINEILIDLTGI